MKDRNFGWRIRLSNAGEVSNVVFFANLGHRSMDRQTESFVCLSLIVILLQNTGRSHAECSKRYTDSPGQIFDSLHRDNRVGTGSNGASSSPSSSHQRVTSCYRILAPPDHYIVLNITRLEGAPLSTGGYSCMPRLVVRNVRPGDVASSSPSLSSLTTSLLVTLCDGERPLPRVVTSLGNELRLGFKSQVWQTSVFQASFTFHKRRESHPCVACALMQEVNKSMNTSFTLFPHNQSTNTHIASPDGAGEGSASSGAWHMEYFFLVVLAPLTVVCLCCVIMFYYRRSSRLPSPSPSLPTSNYSIAPDNPQVHVGQSPLISSHRFSAQHQQERLRKQREIVCPRSESTEKFPTSVCLLDEDEPVHMRDSVRIHREVMSENGIRAPPNRTVYDSERQDLMIQQQCRSGKTENRHSVRRTPSTTSSKRASGIRLIIGGGVKQGATITTATSAALQVGGAAELVDSETRSPLNLIDSDSEGPPPYTSLAQQINNNIINHVCDASSSPVSTRSHTDGRMQSQQQQLQQHHHQAPPPPSSPAPCQPNSNGRHQGNPRGANRGSSVRLKGGDGV